MKKIIKKDIQAFTEESSISTSLANNIVEYPHDSPLLEEIAGIQINKMLKLRRITTEDYGGDKYHEYRLELMSFTPKKASLFISQTITDQELRQAKVDIENLMYQKMVEELLYKAMEAVDRVHNFKKEF